ncbi:TonB-dependent receptor [Palleniella muris]|uniref:TonB-dependent receptor n=1 Tax=Palleniella muris TaxID=3038145 RepID=A0AC61QS21_9BACT|nr:TonB-dependent receptor [Palleniella muris]TGX83130.1 TonB-dependent receptor [Palleniella muris]
MQKKKTFVNKAMKAMLVAGFAATMSPLSAFAGGSVEAFVQARQNAIKGTVVDEAGEPMIGVTIKVKNSQAAAITDLDGNFSVNASEGATIEVSYVGYTTQTVKAHNGMKVQLVPDSQVMDEVVVIGYGTVKKRDVTGAVASIKKEDIVIAPTSNAMEALQGKVAGMDIVKGSGQIGDEPEILLRGTRSIYGSNEPLFIIDGIQGSYSEVNPSDIETIDILKDASSTAIYGSAGANGVVIITTKRGQAGKVRVNFDAYYGWSGSPNYENSMTGDEWVNYHQEAYKYEHGNYAADMATLFGNQDYLDAYNAGKWIDWVDLVSGNKATTQKYSLSVTGGTDKTKIYASAIYSKDKGLLSNEQRDKYALRLNIDQEINKWAKLGFTSNLTYANHDRGVKNTFTRALTAFPLGDAYDAEGNIVSEYINGQYSPLGDFIPNQYTNETRTTYVNTTGFIELTPFKGMSIRSQISGSMSHARQGLYWGALCNANRPTYAGTPHAEKVFNDSWSYTWENVFAYNTTIAKDHSIGGTFITSWSESQSEPTTAGGSGQTMDSWLFHRLNAATSQYIKSEYTQTQKMSYAVRFNYSYKGRYLFTASNRWDGVSWLSEGNKWESFPAAAVAWRISDEAFMGGMSSWLDNLKVRVGWGITGNSGGIGAYGTQSQPYPYSGSGVTVDGKIVPFYQYTGTYASPDLTWEKSYNWNIGLDFSVLNSRIDGSIEWFSTKTRGLLFARQMPSTTGITGWGSPLKVWQNLAKTSNHGVEFTINSRNIRTKDFSWNTSLTGTWQKEKIEELPDGDLIAENLFVGSPIKSVYGYKYAGIWGTDTDKATLDAYGVEPGFIKVETNEKFDADGVSDNGVHKYGEDDRRILGHRNPNWILGLNNTFAYKNIDLTIYAMGRFGQTIESSMLGYYTADNSLTKNQPSGVDYWTEDNQGAFYPRPGTGGKQSTVYPSLRVVDGSFIKIKNITLGYTLPKSLTRKALIENCRIYFTTYNPFIFSMDSRLNDTDPETGGADSFPTYKQYVIGINLTF